MSRKSYITEDKAKRIAIGATVAGILLIVFLLIILIVQFVQIGVRNSRKSDLEQQIEEYEKRLEDGNRDLNWYLERDGLYWTARTYGWK